MDVLPPLQNTLSMDELIENHISFEKQSYNRGTRQKNTFPVMVQRDGGNNLDFISKNIQDRFLERLMEEINTLEDPSHLSDNSQSAMNRSPFSIITMSGNFRQFNARIGVIFDFQEKVGMLLSWNTPAQTMSFLMVYSIICLDPYLISVSPFAILLSLLTLSYHIRHPFFIMAHDSKYHTADMADLHRASNRSIKERSINLIHNLRGLQNTMGDYSFVYDQITNRLVPLTDFSNEALSTTLFIFSFISFLFFSTISHFIPWRSIFLLAGWISTCVNHPTIQRYIPIVHERLVTPYKTRFKTFLDAWISQDISLDSSETREVEVFEIQHISSGGEWEPWLFSRNPFDPSSGSRTLCDRHQGTHLFKDVLSPPGWQWLEKKWTLDLWSREWVEERLITGVEVEPEGERWVYDLNYESQNNVIVAGGKEGLVDHHSRNLKSKLQPSWEENYNTEDSGKRRGQWRQRRWVRIVRHRMVHCRLPSFFPTPSLFPNLASNLSNSSTSSKSARSSHVGSANPLHLTNNLLMSKA